MAWTKYQIFLAVLMVVTGSINTIIAKFADITEAESSDGTVRHFNHPFLQAVCMFIGEFLCLVVFKILYKVYSRKGDGTEDVKELTKGNRKFNPFIFFIPSMCDMLATSIMYVGLNMTYASSFQMLRGAVIVFTGIFSMIFLHRFLKILEWVGIFFIIAGLVTVGAADMLSKNEGGHTKSDLIIGDVLIALAQILSATQMVVEEKFVSEKDVPPLQAVGWEGIFGFAVLSILLIPFYFIHIPPPFSDNPREVVEDAIDAFVQMGHNPIIILALIGTIISIAFFNFAGISVTKEINATTRMVLDSIRTIVIWVFSLACFGQKFHWLQLLGFFGIIVGMCLYNGIIPDLCIKCWRKRRSQDGENKPADASTTQN